MFLPRLLLAILLMSSSTMSAAFCETLSAPSAPSAAVDAKRPIRDKWALVVGISKFETDKIPTLKYSTKDARDFYNYLVKEANFQPSHVRMLLDEKTTRRRIISELGNRFLARLAQPGDLIVLFLFHSRKSLADGFARKKLSGHI